MNTVYLVANGDLRLSANQKCEPAQAAMEKALAHGGPHLISVEVTRDSEVSPWAFIHPPKP